jgi:hypothetical protein
VTFIKALAKFLVEFFARQMWKSLSQPVNKKCSPELGQFQRLQEPLFWGHLLENPDISFVIQAGFDVHHRSMINDKI